MLTSFFVTAPYRGPGKPGWPRPPRVYDTEVGLQSFKESTAEIEYADEVGFDWISISEHHYGFSMAAVPTLYGMHIANHTKRAKVAVLGPSMPLNNPIRVAEELSLLDNFAEGRLVVGLLRGTPNEYQVYSKMPEETRALTMEGMEIVLKAWTEPEPFSWEGKHYQYRMVSVWPRTYQQPTPPMYALGNSADTCDFAARHRMGMGVSFGTFEGNARSTAYYRERCEAYGWTPKPEQMIYRSRAVIGETAKDVQNILDSRGGLGSSEAQLRHNANVMQVVGQKDPNRYHTGGGPMPGKPDLAPESDDLPALVRHATYLAGRFPRCRLAISLPRIHGAPSDFKIGYPVDDDTFVRLYCAARIALPQAELVLSTREPPDVRARLAGICITQMSAGSSTVPGGYADCTIAESDGGQFPVYDHRSPAEVTASLDQAGITPLWTLPE